MLASCCAAERDPTWKVWSCVGGHGDAKAAEHIEQALCP